MKLNTNIKKSALAQKISDSINFGTKYVTSIEDK